MKNLLLTLGLLIATVAGAHAQGVTTATCGGVRVPVWVTETRPSSPNDGTTGFNRTTGYCESYSAAAGGWQAQLALSNLPAISPLTTSGGTSPVTVFAAGAAKVSIVLSATTSMSASGDGTTPVIGDAHTVVANQTLYWPSQVGGAMPTGPVQVVCSSTCTITAGAR